MKHAVVFVSFLVAGCGSSTPKTQTSRVEPVAPAGSTGDAAPNGPATTPAVAKIEGPCSRDDIFGPFKLTGEQMLQRRGLGDRLFSDTVSTPEAPIQVCGTGGELGWLTRVTCADGSKPFARDQSKAHAARQGSSTGPRPCGSETQSVPIDHYVVPCPEKTYDVYMDMYECGPGEPFPH